MIYLEELILLVLVGSVVAFLIVAKIPAFKILTLHGKTYQESPNANIISWISKNLTVPKKWFLHFYVVYLALCVAIKVIPQSIWNQISKPMVYESIRENGFPYLVYNFICIQALRRLLESLFVTKFSDKAKINVAHYFVGIIFYTAISLNTGLAIKNLSSESLYWGFFNINMDLVSWIDIILIVIFMVASIDQFFNHYYLSTLVKYTEPKSGLFSIVAAPHYFDEITIYMVVAIAGCRTPSVSTTIQLNYIFCFIFAFVNLSISASENLNFYREKGSIKKYAIIPYIL